MLQHELEDIGKFDQVFTVSAETGFGLRDLKEYLLDQAKRRPWKHHPETTTSLSEVERCEQIMTAVIFGRFFKEIPYKISVEVKSWVPKSDGKLRVEFSLGVNHGVIRGIVIGKGGRIVDGLRKDAAAALSKHYQKPVQVVLQVVEDRGHNAGKFNDQKQY